MERQTTGTVVAVKRQWWCKVNRKIARAHALDGAEFPCIVQIEYAVDGKTYTKRKWYSAGVAVPGVGRTVFVMYRVGRPARARVLR